MLHEFINILSYIFLYGVLILLIISVIFQFFHSASNKRNEPCKKARISIVIALVSFLLFLIMKGILHNDGYVDPDQKQPATTEVIEENNKVTNIDSESTANPPQIVEQQDRKTGKVLPFTLCRIMNNNMYMNNLSMLDLDIKVNGGHSNDWVSTGIAIAKHLGALGVSTDVKVTLYRSDLGALEAKAANGYKWLAIINYGIDPKHSIAAGQDQWLISYAADKDVVIPKDIRLINDYNKVSEKYGDDEQDKVDKIIQKKYGLKKGWQLPHINIERNTNNPNEYNIDESDQTAELTDLEDIAKNIDNSVHEFNCN